jgi:regulator of sirC expression with transglutaminase-like and TPR domain
LSRKARPSAAFAAAMKNTVPAYCRPEAFELFARHVGTLHEPDSLLLAAIAVSLHALDDVAPQVLVERIDALAAEVRRRAPSGRPRAIAAHLHEVLFDEQGFRGNTDDYYSPLNSYVPVVLEAKVGLPITLALIYKSVAERAGLRVDGVNAPGHFLARVYVGDDVMLVDPFHGGQVLSPIEALDRIAAMFHEPLTPDLSLLATATPVGWLSRMLGNLRGVFASSGRRNDLAAMNELIALLPRA